MATQRWAVVGGGLVGSAIALRLQIAGFEVLLVDRGDPRRGASFGNIGHIAAEQGEVTGEIRLTAVQSAFMRASLPNRDHFNQSVLLKCEEEIDEEALKTALSSLAAHHDMLRATFTEEGARIEGVSARQWIPLHIFTCENFEEAAACGDEIESGLHIETGPIARAALIKLPFANYLLIAVHHMAMSR